MLHRLAHARRHGSLSHTPMPLMLALALLAGCGAGAPQGGPVAHSHDAGHILVQVFRGPGFMYPPLTFVPEWTLYGDGTLLYQAPSQPPNASNPTGLLAAHLSSSEVDHVLDVIVNQDAFFASARASYGQYNPDIGPAYLTVDAAGKVLQVRLGQTPGPSPDSETAHVFAIASFLRGYHPTQATPYVATGVALLIYRQAANGAPVRPWPYTEISLPQAAADACAYLSPPQSTCPGATGGHAGLAAIYGSRAMDALRFLASGPDAFEQSGSTYSARAFPLLPDALQPGPGAAPGTQIVTTHGIQRVPLIPPPPAQ